MEANPLYIPLILWSMAALLLWLGIRGWRRKSVLGWAGNPKTTAELGYYPIMAGYLMGGILVLILALADAHARWGLGLTILLGILPPVLIFFLSRIRLKPLAPLKRISKLGKRKAPAEAEESVEISPQSRALATAALLAQVKGLDLHTLGGAVPGPRTQKLAQKRLRAAWQIEDAEDMEESLEWLMESGHRKEFHQQIGIIQHWNEEETNTYLAEVSAGKYGLDSPEEQDEERHRILMAQQNIHGLRGTSFMAWDYLRAIDLCREGFLAGYMESEAVWSQIYSLAQVLQSRYESWEQMGRAFLVGHEYWSVVQHQTEGPAYQRALALLLNNPDSYWNQIPWESSLYQRQ